MVIKREAMLVIQYFFLQLNSTVTALAVSPGDTSTAPNLLQCDPWNVPVFNTALLCNSINSHCCCTVLYTEATSWIVLMPQCNYAPAYNPVICAWRRRSLTASSVYILPV